MPGIAELYVESATRQIAKCVAEGAEHEIKRANIEWTLLEALDGSDLALEYKIAFYAAILNCKKFDIFWLGQKAFHGLSETAILPFVPNSALEQFDIPSPVTVSSDAESDDADLSALKLSSQASPFDFETAEPGHQRRRLKNERRVSFDLPFKYSNPVGNGNNDSDFDNYPKSEGQDENADGARAKPGPSDSKRPTTRRQTVGCGGVAKKRNAAKAPRTPKKAASIGEKLGDSAMEDQAVVTVASSISKPTGKNFSAKQEAVGGRAKRAAAVKPSGVDWQSPSHGLALVSEEANSIQNHFQLCSDTGRSFGDGANDSMTGVSDAELLGEYVDIAANAAAYQGLNGGGFAP